MTSIAPKAPVGGNVGSIGAQPLGVVVICGVVVSFVFIILFVEILGDAELSEGRHEFRKICGDIGAFNLDQ